MYWPRCAAFSLTFVAALLTATTTWAQQPPKEYETVLATLGKRMGLNTWAAFVGTAADAMVAGDVAMLEEEVTGVLRTLRSNGIDVVAIHHHMTDSRPVVIFLH